jgi:diguanylate cyclase (GGDEF)-like protein/PAS domain S-box-containing protein
MSVYLFYSIAVLFSLSLFYGLIVHYFYTSNVTQKILTGILFGGICVIGMMLPVELNPGNIFDTRTVVLSISAIFGGPIVAIIAAVIAGSYRIFLGGMGVYVGISIVIISTCFGLAYRYAVQKGWAKINVPQLLLFGLLVHFIQILLYNQLLPVHLVDQVMAIVVIPLLLILAPTTALLGLLLKTFDERIKTDFALRESESRLYDHLHNTPLAAISWDVNFHVTQWNKAAEKMFGYTADEAIGRHPTGLIVSGVLRTYMDQIYMDLLQNKGGKHSSNDNVTKDGKTINCEWHNTALLDGAGKIIGAASLCEDVTARKQSELLIWQQAHYDLLTGLANRQMANSHLIQEIKIADNSNKSIALLFLDLDGFKDINDTLGHDVGDKLLIQAARRLTSLTREVDTIARLGGDEFVIIVGGLESPYNVDRFANNLIKKMTEPFELDQQTINISTSIGITLYPQDASNPNEIMRNADQAMYAAKHKGGNSFQYFTPSMHQNALSRMSLISDLRKALPNNEFQLYYQPIINLKNGDIHKAEALIRWQHPEKGLIGPYEFISIAEETKLIVDIGDWVFREASQQCALWRTSLHQNFQISINTSPVQYQNDAFSTKAWLDHLHSLDLLGDAISVEITEGTLMESGTIIDQILLDFRDANIQVSLDDFGTGYSSLSALKRLDIDYLKIDKLFVDNLALNSDDLALCEAIIVMAHRLDIKVIAEGIETEQQKDLLIAAGCDYGQGYLFAKPLPKSEFEGFLKPS